MLRIWVSSYYVDQNLNRVQACNQLQSIITHLDISKFNMN